MSMRRSRKSPDWLQVMASAVDNYGSACWLQNEMMTMVSVMHTFAHWQKPQRYGKGWRRTS
jgi:hypothetical protein